MRLQIEVSEASFELIKRALEAHITTVLAQSAGLAVVGDVEEFKRVQTDYFHGKAFLKKLEEGRSFVEGV
jgi:hypothetical protein